MSVEVHPFDVFSLSKGQYIPPESCEPVLNLRRSDKKYSQELMALAALLEKQWLELRDEQVTITCQKDGILICTDEKAVYVNRARRQGHVRGLERAQRRQMGVDLEKVETPEAKKLHERELVVGAAFLVSGRQQARAALSAHRRQTPGLLSPKRK